MKKGIALIIISLFALLTNFSVIPKTASAIGTTYYISNSGSDSNIGTSISKPWKTINKVNSVNFQSGDKILFMGGQTFSGTISFNSNDKATAVSPITISSYGTGRATINSGSDNGLFAYNTGGYEISNLNFVGSGRTTDTKSGINFYNDLAGNIKLDYIRIDNIEASNYGDCGVILGGWNMTSGYKNVHITNAIAHDNARCGIQTYGQTMYANNSVYIGYSRAYNNPGIATMTTNSGSGITLGDVDGGIIEYSIAYGNGANCTANECGVGIWAYDSNNITLQYNESYSNKSGSNVDGDGFDFDQNVTNSFMQYNYSHDNDGAGILLCHRFNDNKYQNNVIRYNVSENDARKLTGYGAITLWGKITNTEIYNNTVYISPSAAGNAHGIVVSNWGIEDRDVNNVHLRNNIVQTVNEVPLLEITNGQLSGAINLLFQGNNYYSDNKFIIEWGGIPYFSLNSWRNGTSQEKVNGADSGFNIDPKLTNPGKGGMINDVSKLSNLLAYQLQPDSPLIDKGLNLQTLFSQNPGFNDFSGTNIPQGNGYEIGSSEVSMPHVLLTKSVNKTLVQSGDILTYTIICDNLSPITANNVIVRDILPPNTTYLDNTVLPSTNANYDTATRALSWQLNNLNGQSKQTLTFQAKVN